MDPASFIASVLGKIAWDKLGQDLAKDTVKTGAKSLWGRLQSSDQEKTAKIAIELFVREFTAELEDKTPLTAALPGYQDQLRRVIEAAAPDIVEWLQPEPKDVDLGSVRRMWEGMKANALPEGFDWNYVAKGYERAIRKHVRNDPALRAQFDTALLEQQTAAIGRIAPLDPGFNLPGYREYLRKKCASLQLSAMHTSTYDRRVPLWSVFVPQTAREAAPVRDLPREVLRRLRMEGHAGQERDDEELASLRERYQGSPAGPILDAIERQRLVVVLGDPGSGKTSLLKYLTMRWATEDRGPLPLWIDLKEYARERAGFLKHCESGCTTYGLDAKEVEKRLEAGEAALYLDGLDEIFDPPTRGGVIDDIAAFAARHAQARVVVTSRIVGYESDRLGHAEFLHATLEDFDDDQVSEFLAKWHEAAEDDAGIRARLQRALEESRAVRELAGNPLLLTMMAILNRNQDLPRDRVELYQQASRLLLHEWDAQKFLPEDVFGRQEKEELLRELAGAMQQAEGGLAGNLIERGRLVELIGTYLKDRLGTVEFRYKANLLVNQLVERNFILCFAGAERFSFVHRTFLEYFCAAWFVERFQKQRTLTLEKLKNDVFGAHWKDETWHEVLRLIAGMVGERQAEELILFLMAQDGSEDKLANLMLAAGCLSEVRNRRAIRATDEALWERFVEDAVRYEPPYYYEPYDEWFEAGATREKAVGLIASAWRSEGTRQWLRSAVEHDADEIVRQAAVQQLARGWKTDPDTLPLLKDRARFDNNGDVRRASLLELALGWKTDSDTLPLLKGCARTDKDVHVRRTALQELARGWRTDPDTLPLLKDRALSDENGDARRAAIQELARGWKTDPKTLPWLKERARADDNDGVRQAAVQELARGWDFDPDTPVFLRDCARSGKGERVRMTAVEELARGWKADSCTLPLLKELARSNDHVDVRRVAIQGLVAGWRLDSETLPLVKDIAHCDECGGLQRVAIRELAREWKTNPETLPLLKELARGDKSEVARMTAVEELARGWKTEADTLPLLKDRARQDASWVVRMAALLMLARGWKTEPDPLPCLMDRASSDENGDVRIAALLELAHGWKLDPNTPDFLKACARSDENYAVRRAAVRQLARGWRSSRDVRCLLRDRARSDENGLVRLAATLELARGWKSDPDTLPLLIDLARSDKNDSVGQAIVRELERGWKADSEVIELVKSLRS